MRLQPSRSFGSTPPPRASRPKQPRSRGRPAAIAALLAVLLLPVAVLAGWPSGAAQVTARPAPAGTWGWPLVPDPEVIRPFDKPAQRWLPGHRGVDLAAAAGDAVHSPADGTVRFAGVVVDRGVLTIDHGDGIVSSFEPVTASVAVGEPVTAGQPIGLLGSRGDPAGGKPEQPHCPSSCLHWGVRLDGDYVDPLRYVTDRRPSVLLPLAGGPDG